MPKTKNKMRRFAIIISELNTLETIKIVDLQKRVEYRLGEAISKSTIEKDLFDLRMDFDVELIGCKTGIRIESRVDFIERLKQLFSM